MDAERGFEVAHVDSLDEIPVGEGLIWRPVRRRFGIRAFGVNAYTSEGEGGQVVEEHDETGGGAGGHEELYVVLRGRATFTVDGETLDAPAGTLVFVRDPALQRVAISEEEGTMVLAIGGEPGHAYIPSPWEANFVALPLVRAGRNVEAIEVLQDGLREHPGNAAILYNLARAEALRGHPLEAVSRLQQAVAANPAYLDRARTDPDLDSIRREQGFPTG
jgi:quercetin dioxygenase-like cupin family protein